MIKERIISNSILFVFTTVLSLLYYFFVDSNIAVFLLPFAMPLINYPILWISVYINGMFLFIYFGRGLFGGVLTAGVVMLMVLSTFIKNPKIYIKKQYTRYLVIMFLIGLLLSVSLYWSNSPIYGLFKVQGFWLSSFLPFVCILLLSSVDKLPLKKIENLLVFFSVIATFILVLTNLSTIGSGRNTIEGVNTIWNSRDIGTGTLIIYSFLKRSSEKNYLKITYFMLFITNIIGMLINGSRGPLISVFLSIAILELFIMFGKRKLTRKVVIRFLYFVVLSVILVGIVLQFTDRFSISYLINDSNVIERVEYVTTVFNRGIERLGLGNGIGSYSYLFSGVDARIYPHNIFIEVLVENGVIVLILMAKIIVDALKLGIYSENIWVAISIFYLSNAMVSGDLFSNAIVFIPLAILIGSTCTEKRNNL